MHMISHQNVRVDVTAGVQAGFSQQVKVSLAVLFMEETRLTIITTLNDVLRDSR